MSRVDAALLLVALATVACNERESPAANEPLPTRDEPAPLSDEAVDQAELPVTEDFEDEAFRTIDEDNLEDRIDALEKEIAADVD
jgi:hypothetical protein